MVIPVRRRALRIAKRLALCAALLGAGACSKAPDNPRGPGRPAPKTGMMAPAPQAGPADVAGVIRIPVSPADSSGTAALVRRPARIWI